MFEISANVAGYGMDSAVVCCFDPTIVVVRLQQSFPDVEVIPRDFAWRDFDEFKQRGVVEGAVRIAENDARRRGPIWTFRFPTSDGEPIHGKAERYVVAIWSRQPVPEPLRSQFIAFLETLKFAPCVTVQSIRLEGNTTFPA